MSTGAGDRPGLLLVAHRLRRVPPSYRGLCNSLESREQRSALGLSPNSTLARPSDSFLSSRFLSARLYGRRTDTPARYTSDRQRAAPEPPSPPTRRTRPRHRPQGKRAQRHLPPVARLATIDGAPLPRLVVTATRPRGKGVGNGVVHRVRRRARRRSEVVAPGIRHAGSSPSRTRL